MKRSMMKVILVIIAILLTLFILFALHDTNTESVSSILTNADSLERHVEMTRHEKLLAMKSNPRSSLSEFTTDGCSGGLSVGWEYWADIRPKFKETHGNVPAWQSCCETHDLAYHGASSKEETVESSFEARQKADLELKACVIETGVRRSPELTKEYDISETELAHLYNGIANLMYGAVRIGGMPCTDLPWRWGYGWPECR